MLIKEWIQVQVQQWGQLRSRRGSKSGHTVEVVGWVGEAQSQVSGDPGMGKCDSRMARGMT